MSVRSGQSITVEFTTASPTTGAATNADSTPTGTLVVNGTDNAAVVTVTNVDTGRYKVAVTLPTLAIGDIVELSIAATVSAIAGKAIVWRDSKDVLLDSSGDVTFNNTTLATVTTIAGSLTTYDNGDGNLKANVKATDYLVNTTGKLWVLDGSGNAVAPAATALTTANIPTTAQVADKVLGRSIAGGSDGGRTVSEALAASRNKVAFDVPSSGQFTVYAADDTTPLWTGTYTRGATTLGPLTAVDPV